MVESESIGRGLPALCCTQHCPQGGFRSQTPPHPPPPPGVLTVRLQVSGADGSVVRLEWLADTLVPLPAGPDLPADQIRAGIQQVLADALTGETERTGFPPSQDGSDTFITLPIVFD